MTRFRLTHAQKRIIDTELVISGTNINLIPHYIVFPAGQAGHLVRAVQMVLDEVPDLQRRFALTASGEVESYLLRKKDETEILFEDLGASSSADLMERLRGFLSEPFGSIFDARLFQFLVLAGRDETLLGIRMHHSISDGTGMANLTGYIIGCFEACACGRGCTIPENSYHRYIEMEAEYLESEACAADRAYFRDHLGDLTDCPEHLYSACFESGAVQVQLPPALTKKLVQNFGSGGKPVSPFLLSLALVNVFLARYYRSQTIALTAGYNGRMYDDEINRSIGMMVSTVPLKTAYDAKMPFSSFIGQAKTELKGGLTHSRYPLDLLLTDLRSERIDADRLLNFTIVSNSFSQNPDYPIFIPDYAAATVPLVFRINMMVDDRDGLQTIDLNYRKDCFTEDQIRSMAGSLLTMLEDVARDPDQACGRISLISEEDKEALARFNDTANPFEDDTITGLFRKRARAMPDRPAVTFDGRTLTYGELDRRTDILAGHIVSLGVKPEDRVAILIDRSEYMAVYPLAVLKAGAAYLPLDPTFPAERLEYMLSDADVRLVLSEGSMPVDHIPGFQGQIILRKQTEDIESPPVVLPDVTPRHAFVVLYTSGSTGQPKGCILEHQNLVNFCQWYEKFYALTSGDRGAAYANFAFDAHMMDLYPFLIAGAEVFIVPSSLRLDFVALNDFFEQNKITVGFMTTMLGKQFLDTFENRSLRVLTIGGESMPPVKLPSYPLFNAYGPTECTVLATVHEVQHDADGRNIGAPIDNCECHILDEALQPLPVGAVGELCISGAGVGRGYLNRPELTAEKFVDWQGQRLYRTGDYARWLPQGEIEFLGRIDGQVKMRGLRIELGEIENRIGQYEGITGSAVVVKTIGGTEHLSAYYASAREIDITDLKQALAADLTSFMIPTSFTRLDKIPLTPNGKVNRKALPDPVIQKQETVLPRTKMEQTIYEIVSEVLGSRDFGVTDDLFTIGLTSLLAIRVSVLLWNKAGLKVPTNDILKGKTIEHLADTARADTAEMIKAEERKSYPLTGSQLGVFVDSEKNPDTLIYNIPLKITCTGTVDPDRLQAAVIRVIDAHPCLKTELAYEEGRPVQVRRDFAPARVDVVRGRSPDDVISGFLKPFTLIGSELYRAVVSEYEGSTMLLFDVHHIIFDGGSQRLFLEDVKRTFAGLPPETESMTAFDWALEEEKAAAGPAYSRAREYFQDRLQVQATRLAPQADPDGRDRGVTEVTLEAGGIESFCRQQGVTASNLFLASLISVLSCYAGEPDVAISTISNGRGDVRLAQTCGMFVKTLPAVGRLLPGTKVSSFVRGVQEDAFAAVEHELFPLTAMSAEFGFNPSIIYAYQGGMETPDGDHQLRFEVEAMELDAVKMPLAVNIFAGQDFRIVLEYDGRQYREDFMARLARAVAFSAAWMAAHPDAPIEQVPLVSKDEESLLLAISAGETLDYDRSLTSIDRFKAQAARRPDAAALVDSEGRLSYGQADRCSDVLAAHLAASGVTRGSYVGIMLPRRTSFMVSALAVMKAGAAYIPIDADYPADRILHILTDSGACVLLSTGSLRKKIPDPSLTVILVDQFDFEPKTGLTLPELPVPADRAYMIYTSGSTGKPKGVTITHEALAALTAWCREEFSIRPEDNTYCYSSFSFDASVLELFPPLTAGAALHIIDEAMRYDLHGLNRYLHEEKITGGAMSTQVGMELLNQFDPPLRYVMLGGEKLLPVKAKNVQLYNGYGPTEFTVASSFHAVDAKKSYANIPIGRPVPNAWNYVLDRHLHLLPEGVPGELCLAGRQISLGYHNREDLTAKVFVPNPYSTSPDNRMLYRTGDLVRWNQDHELEFLGRIDTQVKIRGFRIELGEIESVLKRFAGITACTVDVRKAANADQICAYYTAPAAIDPDALKAHLQESLPEYMVPAAYLQLESLPLTPNGKVDKKALPDPALSDSTAYAPPENDLQALICKLYAAVLKAERVGLDDDFFRIGGNSLLAMSLVTRCMNEGLAVVYEDVFRCKTPRRLWEKLAGGTGPAALAAGDGYDYQAIDRLMKQNRIADPAGMGLETLPLGDILLTGATGFLGIHVLRELLDSYENKVYCLVREKGHVTAEERLKALLHYYFEHDYADLFGSRIELVNGDLAEPDTLSVHAQTVINCAANVKHFAQGDELDRINIGGVRHLIDYCKKNGAALVHVSTSSVGDSVKREADRITFTENRLYFGQDLENKYICSKFMAERYILQAAAEGLHAKVMRVGNLMSRHADGEFQINLNGNAFMGTLRAYRLLGVFPVSAAHDRVEFSPIDMTARAILKLASTGPEYTVFHPFNTHKVYMADVIAALNEYGFPVQITDDKAFSQVLQAKLQDEAAVKYLVGILAYRRGEEAEPLYRNLVDNRFTSDILLRLGFRWPLITEAYIERAIEALDGLGYFDVTAAARA